MLLAGGLRDGGQLQPHAADDRQKGVDRQQQPPRARPGHESRDERRQKQQRRVAEDLPDGQIARHPLAGNDRRQQRVHGHLHTRIADAQQPESGEIPPQRAVGAGGIGDHHPDAGESVSEQRGGLAAPTVHERGDGRRQHQEPQEDHRRQEADRTLLSGGEIRGDTPRDRGHQIAETHDEEARQDGSEEFSGSRILSHPSKFAFFRFFKVTFFSAKTVSSVQIFSRRCVLHGFCDAGRHGGVPHGSVSPKAPNPPHEAFGKAPPAPDRTTKPAPALVFNPLFSYICFQF